MSSDPDALPEPDRADGAPHPRDTFDFEGQDDAEAQVLEALNGGRMHHAWLITGPRGVGKATLAWRMARNLLAESAADTGFFGDAPAPQTSLSLAPDHPVSRRLSALSEPGLFLLRRAWDPDKKRLKTVITVDEVRKLKGFFGLSATDGGHRVVIVDSVDDMNPSAANALLKVLEEPPRGAVLLLVSHHPARLLPTIRSRCREVRLGTLSPDHMTTILARTGAQIENPAALAELSGGSVGDALRFLAEDGQSLYDQVVRVFAGCPQIDRTSALAVVEKAGARGADARLDLTIRLIDLFLARLARTGAGQPPEIEATSGELDVLHRLSPNAQAAQHWAKLYQSLGNEARHARAVNLDPQSLLLDMVLKVNETAGLIRAAP